MVLQKIEKLSAHEGDFPDLTELQQANQTALDQSKLSFQANFDTIAPYLSQAQWESARLSFDGNMLRLTDSQRSSSAVTKKMTPALRKAILAHDQNAIRATFSKKDLLALSVKQIKQFTKGKWVEEDSHLNPFPKSYLLSKIGFALTLKNAFAHLAGWDVVLYLILPLVRVPSQLTAYQSACLTIKDPNDSRLDLINQTYLSQDYSGLLNFNNLSNQIDDTPATASFKKAKIAIPDYQLDYLIFYAKNKSAFLTQHALILNKKALANKLALIKGKAKASIHVITKQQLDRIAKQLRDDSDFLLKQEIQRHSLSSLVSYNVTSDLDDDRRDFEHFHKDWAYHFEETSYQGALYKEKLATIANLISDLAMFNKLPAHPTVSDIKRAATSLCISDLFLYNGQFRGTTLIKEELDALDLTLDDLVKVPKLLTDILNA